MAGAAARRGLFVACMALIALAVAGERLVGEAPPEEGKGGRQAPAVTRAIGGKKARAKARAAAAAAAAEAAAANAARAPEAWNVIWSRRLGSMGRYSIFGAFALLFWNIRLDDSTPEKRFVLLDADKDGFVDREEYMQGIRNGPFYVNADEDGRANLLDMMGRLIKNVDLDGDGKLNLREFEYSEFLGGVVKEMHTPANYQSEPGVPGKEFGLNKAAEGFMRFDANRDRFLDRDEFLNGISAFAKEYRVDVDEALEGIWDKADVTGDGLLGLRESQFAGFLINEYIVKLSIRQTIDALDLDGDGSLSPEELEAAARAYVPFEGLPNVGQLMLQMFAEHDKNGDALLDAEELDGMMYIMMRELNPDKANLEELTREYDLLLQQQDHREQLF